LSALFQKLFWLKSVAPQGIWDFSKKSSKKVKKSVDKTNLL
jgi:hypothetical protein